MSEQAAQRLSERYRVPLDRARAALILADGDLLNAAELLEREDPAGPRQVGYYSTAQGGSFLPVPAAPEPRERLSRQLLQLFKGLFAHPLANALEVRTRDRVLTIVPAGVLAALLLVAFWITLGLLALGVLAGCRFTLIGPQWAIPEWNAVLEDLRAWLGLRWTELLRRAKAGRRK